MARAGARRRRGEDGTAVVQLVFVMPALLLLILAVFEFVVFEHARNVAASAAEQGLEAARVQGGSDADGVIRAQAALAQLGPSIIRDPQVHIVRTANTVRVEITGSSEPVIPGMSIAIDQVVEGPVERVSAQP